MLVEGSSGSVLNMEAAVACINHPLLIRCSEIQDKYTLGKVFLKRFLPLSKGAATHPSNAKSDHYRAENQHAHRLHVMHLWYLEKAIDEESCQRNTHKNTQTPERAFEHAAVLLLFAFQ